MRTGIIHLQPSQSFLIAQAELAFFGLHIASDNPYERRWTHDATYAVLFSMPDRDVLASSIQHDFLWAEGDWSTNVPFLKSAPVVTDAEGAVAAFITLLQVHGWRIKSSQISHKQEGEPGEYLSFVYEMER